MRDVCFCFRSADKEKRKTWRQAKSKIYSRKFAFAQTFCWKFNACRQVFNFSKIRSKVSEAPRSSFPKSASNRRYPTAFCAHPVSSIPDNSKFQKTGKTGTFSVVSKVQVSFINPHKEKIRETSPDIAISWIQSTSTAWPDHLSSPPLNIPLGFLLWGIVKGTSSLGKSRNIPELLTDGIHRRCQNSISGISLPFYPGNSKYFPVFLNLSSFR